MTGKRFYAVLLVISLQGCLNTGTTFLFLFRSSHDAFLRENKALLFNHFIFCCFSGELSHSLLYKLDCCLHFSTGRNNLFNDFNFLNCCTFFALLISRASNDSAISRHRQPLGFSWWAKNRKSSRHTH